MITFPRKLLAKLLKALLIALLLQFAFEEDVYPQCPWNPAGSIYNVTSKQDNTFGCLRYAINSANSNNQSGRIWLYVDTVYLLSDLPAITCDSLGIYKNNGTAWVINAQNFAHDTILNFKAPNSCVDILSQLSIINIAGTSYYVTNTNDNGPNSLREKILKTNFSNSPDNIYFNIPGPAPHAIQPITPLPNITNSVIIDGSTQPANGYSGNSPKIELDGSICSGNGLYFTSPSVTPTNNSALYGAFIHNFNYGIFALTVNNLTLGSSTKRNVLSANNYGLYLTDISSIIINSNYIGTTPNGDSTLSNTHAGDIGGISVSCLIQDNLISGNLNGLQISNSGSFDPVIITSNKFGTDKTGIYAIPNNNFALECQNTISSISNNLFSGNNCTSEVAKCQGGKCQFKGNKFGLNYLGNDTITNKASTAIRIQGADSTFIGGDLFSDRNIISPTIGGGAIISWSCSYTSIKNNYIGAYPNGSYVPVNGLGGITIIYSSDSTLVKNNLIAGCGNGIGISHYSFPVFVTSNTITGNNDYAINNNGDCLMLSNSIFNNGYGIYNANFANDSILPPIINNVYADSVVGTSRSNASIELYYSQSQNGTPQGKTYIATVTANTNGNWKYTGTINLSKSVTATQTDSGVYTSEFAGMISNVWPGDCNYDLTVDNLDFLYLNIATGDTGTVRNNASLNWNAQPCHDWNNKFASVVNHKHADTDGNGIVNINDTVAITQNYSLTHPAKQILNGYNSSIPDLKIVIDNDTVSSDSLITLKIFAGDSLFPIDSIYGVKFSVLFDPSLIDTTNISYDFSQSELGILHSNLESFQKTHYTSGKIDFALCRTNHIDTTNFSGLLGIIKIKAKSYVPPMSLLQIIPADIKGITYSENLIDFNAIGDSVVIFRCQNLATVATNQQTYCNGDLMSASVYLLYPAQPSWYIDSLFISNNPIISTDTLSIGPHQLNLTVTNAYCNLEFISSIDVNSLPVINLGNDTTSCDRLVLNSGVNNASYLWSNGKSTKKITAHSSGNYSVLVTDTNGCSNADTINVVINPLPFVQLGNDTSTCNIPITLDAGTGNVSYQWSNGTTTQTIIVSVTANYSVVVTDNNGCSNNDTVNVIVNPLPIVVLGNDTSTCNIPITLDAGVGNVSYQWSNGATTQTIIASANANYSVIVIDGNGCSNNDTVNITVNPLPIVVLGNDTATCNMPVTLDAGTGNVSYQWSNGETT
ncbi:MAG: hypothetical protein ABI723_17160, partial [Bacteroidia bacterium]